jgi:uncharacterized protein
VRLSGKKGVFFRVLVKCATILVATGSLLTIEATAAETGGKHFVWRITNAPARFYLVGSMHALRGSDYPLPGVVDQAIADSQKVIFEIDPDAKDAPLMRSRLLAASAYPSGVRIDQKVSPETFALLKRIARVRLSEYAHHKPWAVAYFTLWQQPDRVRRESRRRLDRYSLKRVDRSARLSIDRYVYNRTRGRKEISGLETIDEFVQGFSNMSDADSESYLLETIGYGLRFPQLFTETIAAWNNGDTLRMYRLYAPRARHSGYWRWLEGRNLIWAHRIEQAIKSGKPTTVVAGSLHFCGPRSIVALLEKRGYKLEQL